MDQNDITLFGETNFRNQKKRFGIKRDDRRRHVYIIGKTGMGKTTLLENMIISDIIHGDGCCYVDPHGDTAEKILDFIPPNRINDVIYFNPSDTEFPIAFNILEAVDEKSKHLIASGLVGVFKKQFAESWGPRLEYILRNAILALLDYPGSTLLGIMRILVDKAYREKVVEKITDPVVKSFWVNEYTKWNDRVLQEVISPIQNKVGQFLSNFLIRNIVGQVKSTFDLREVIDGNKILIMNLSKGRIGEDTMQLLGSMIVTKLYLAAMSRVDILEKDRKDFYLYVDEFQNFATDSFADILSEARKYRLNLTMAHQFIEQLPENVSAAVFGNVGTLMCFRVGAADAETLVKEFTPVFLEEDLVNLPSFSIYLKLMIDGISSDPFSANTLPPLFDEYRSNSTEKVIKVSRERYANSRKAIEDKINRWSGMELSEKMVATSEGRIDFESERDKQDKQNHKPVEHKFDKPKPRIDKKEEEKYIVDCFACGKSTEINFFPDGKRPVFCKDCLAKNRKEKQAKMDSQIKSAPVKKEAERPSPEQNVKTISLSDLGKRPSSDHK
ncbi:MAG: type IV secretion system DNA-binding domain-containing protein [Candidatus Buchananbacteria bacterium]|nr:type IV secretion system DNA-binding domain-containing protein [Candidatus Buchananbacteria bacterium]